MGHMAEAESESIADYPELAALVRLERIKMMDNEGYFTDFEPLIEMASKLAEGEINAREEEEKEVSAEPQGDKGIHAGDAD